MKQCIIVDFEWSVTPHPTGDRFQYFNEILSAGAVRIDESGTVLDRFYALIRPQAADYLHPIILTSLRLDRAALACADPFPKVFDTFLQFVGDTPIFTWGCADRSALLQNLRIKAGMNAEAAASTAPQMRDLQPTLSRGAEIPPPYPSLAAVLSALHIKSENRHNAMADAEDTAQIIAVLYQKDPILLAPLFPGIQKPQERTEDTEASLIDQSAECASESFRTPGEALNHARRIPMLCPICASPAGIGTWIRVSKTEMTALCSCETDGRFLCLVNAVPNDSGGHTAKHTLYPFEGDAKLRYEAARRAARLKRLQNARNTQGSGIQTEKKPSSDQTVSSDNEHTV